MKKNLLIKMIGNAAKFFAKNSANSTTSGTMFQPKEPNSLKKYSKFNDK